MVRRAPGRNRRRTRKSEILHFRPLASTAALGHMARMVQAKICGLTTPETVRSALEGGAAYLGFNFFEKSPRYVAPDASEQLALPARNRGVGVAAVVVDPSDALLDRLMLTLKPDFIQLHGKEQPPRVAEVRARTGVLVIKALPIETSDDLAAAAAFEGAADHLLFDAKAPKGADLPGGNGAAFDWTLLSGRRFARPWFLAGGLHPWNVAEAVKASGAPIVDVSSGVERGPGYKDPALISAFLEAVRRA
jgi:phosphoribosylanthranilate isomerase